MGMVSTSPTDQLPGTSRVKCNFPVVAKEGCRIRRAHVVGRIKSGVPGDMGGHLGVMDDE